MQIRVRSDDDELLRQLLAPPALEDGAQSLAYWRERARHLPWYRIAARREAGRMMILCERNVGAALLAQRGAPVSTTVSAALLLGRSRLSRWGRRARVAVLATVAAVVALVAVPLLI